MSLRLARGMGVASFLLFLGAFAAWPLVRVLGEGIHLSWIEVDAALNTLILATGTIAVAVPSGTVLGVLAARYSLPRLVGVGLLLPYAIPPYVTTIAWITLANPATGVLGVDVYSLAGMVWVLGLHLTPLVAVGVRSAAARIDPAMEEAARLGGAGPVRVLWDITLPLLRPALVTAAGLVGAAAAASFGVPYLLSSAASHPTPVLTTRIATWLDLRSADASGHATTLALLLLVVGVALPGATSWFLRGKSFATSHAGRAPIRRSWSSATLLVSLWVSVAAVVPLLTLLVLSIQHSSGGGLALDNLSLARWAAIGADVRTREALVHSLVLAGLSATVAVGVGFLVGHAATRSRTAPARWLAAAARAPYAVPGTVLALGLLLAWSRELRLIIGGRLSLGLHLSDTFWILGIAYVVKFLALPIDITRAAGAGLHLSLEEAARVSGGRPWRVMSDVTLPLLAPALRGAWFLVFATAFCEVTLSVLLRGPATEVLGTRLFYLQTYADTGAAAVLAALVAGVVGLGLLAGGTRGWAS